MQQNKTRDYFRVAVLGLLSLLLYLLQTTDSLFPKFFGGTAVLLVPAVVFAAMFLREWTGAIFGLVLGILMDITSSDTTSFNSIILTIIGCMVGLLITYIMNNNLFTAIILSLIFTSLYFFIKWIFFYLIKGFEQPLYFLLKYTLPSVVYTFVLSIPLYLIIRRIMKQMRTQKGS